MRLRLTSEQRDRFLADGLVRVPGVLPRDVTDALAEPLWRTITAQIGARRDQPQTWSVQGMAPIRFQQVARTDVFKPAVSAAVRELLDDFFGGRAWRNVYGEFEPRPLGPIFPTLGRVWTVPSMNWHLDGTEPGLWPDRLRMFFYLAPVEPGGGGTFYVAGSNRATVLLIADMAARGEPVGSASVIKALKRESPWIAELCSKAEAGPERVEQFMQRGADFRGFPLRVAEMTAEAGDLVLWHPNLLHTFAPLNLRGSVRTALSATFGASG
jgi:hypothetical protein